MGKTPRINVILVWFECFGEFDAVTSAGKLFHVRAAATGNARSPTVDSRETGRPMPTSTMTAGVVDLESWRSAEWRRPVRRLMDLESGTVWQSDLSQQPNSTATKTLLFRPQWEHSTM